MQIKNICKSIKSQKVLKFLLLVDTTRAGAGRVGVEVQAAASKPRVTISEEHTALYKATFVPTQAGPHDIHVTFNEMNVSGSPFLCQVIDLAGIDVAWNELAKVPIYERATLDLSINQALADNFNITLTDPYDVYLPVSVKRQGHGVLQIEFEPQNVGRHGLAIRYGDKHVQGSPHIFLVYDSMRAVIRDVTTPAQVERPVNFVGKQCYV